MNGYGQTWDPSVKGHPISKTDIFDCQIIRILGVKLTSPPSPP